MMLLYQKGELVAAGVTPTKVSLKRGKGFFKKPPRYVATIKKPGYKPTQVSIQPKVNPWILGNAVLGGVVGLAADSTTGAMWRLTPNEIDQRLTPIQGPLYSESKSESVTQASYVSDRPPR